MVSASVGLALGMDPAAVLTSIKNGMASTLGFIAVVVGLGAIGGLFFRVAQVSWHDYKRAFVCNCPAIECPECSPEYCASLENAACERQFGVGAAARVWCKP